MYNAARASYAGEAGIVLAAYDRVSVSAVSAQKLKKTIKYWSEIDMSWYEYVLCASYNWLFSDVWPLQYIRSHESYFRIFLVFLVVIQEQQRVRVCAPYDTRFN